MTGYDYTLEKRCAKCRSTKPKTEFNKNKSKPDGLATECRPCTKQYGKKYYADDRELSLARRRADYQKSMEAYKARAEKWRVENNIRVNELKAAYRERNREKIKEISKRDWERHKGKRNARKRAYWKERPELALATSKERMARKRQAMPAWADREAMKKVYALSRKMTLETGIVHHVDHFYPLGGKTVCGLHNEFNLRVITASENQSKSNKLIDELNF